MKQHFYILILFTLSLTAQIPQKGDVKIAEESGSSTSFGSHVNESTGKVTASLPITNIASRSLTFPVEITYQGDNVYNQATYKNRHLSTGILGVGWNMVYPKIIADYKNTASRDDDTFYLNGTQLICTKRPHPSLMQMGTKIWEFRLNSPEEYIIKYYDVDVDYDMTNFTVQKLDYWEVTDDKGRVYIYGNTDNTRENVLAWGNWIGDSKAQGAEKHTIVWNVATIKDQYNNNLQFSYLKVENGVNTNSLKHTEASYIRQIVSSTGEKIIFNYALKNNYEYYEPHIEASEPDAYQERYEKNYLNSIATYTSSNLLISNHVFSYITLFAGVESTKRFLTGVTNKNALNHNLPPYLFEYYTTGPFTGHLKKKTIPNGGSMTYNYAEQTLFNNNNSKELNDISVSGLFGTYHNDKYSLYLCSTVMNGVPLSQESTTFMGSFFVVRDAWNGRKWIRSKFTIPEQIRVNYQSGGYFYADNIKFVFGDDYYAFLVYNRNTDNGTLYTFHLQADGTWQESGWSSIHTGGNNDSDASQDPVLISGDEFIAIGTQRIGKLMIYRWNGISWLRDIIEQGSGEYYYGAQNNFIIAANTVTGVDVPATVDPPNTFQYNDRYYLHYLDGERKWQTKSWTSAITGTVPNVSGLSNVYPSNAMASFVAGDNPEFMINWDANYNITGIVNIGAYNDIYPFFPLNSNVFAGVRMGDIGRPYIFKLLAYDGANWVTRNVNHETHSGFGQNRAAGLALDYSAHSLFTFNPNTSAWIEDQLPYTQPPQFNYINMDSFSFANNIFMSGDRIYRYDNNGITPVANNSYYYYQQFAKSGGGEYLYDHHWRLDDPNDLDSDGITNEYIGEKRYYYINKTTNALVSTRIGNLTNNDNALNLYSSANRRAEQFGGKYPFFSATNLTGLKLIDNKFGNDVKNTVVYEIVKDNGMGNITRVRFNFENSHTLQDDETVVYGKVTTTDMGTMSGITNGYTVKYFENGLENASRAGFLLKQEVYRHGGVKVEETVFTPLRHWTNIKNTQNTTIAVNTSWRPESIKKLSYMGQLQVMDNTTTYFYNERGDILTETTINSEGKSEKISYRYADELYPFVKNKNIKGVVATKVKGIEYDASSSTFESTNWAQQGNIVYASQNLSGTTENNQRINNDVLAIDAYGNILETSNGRGISKSVLMGYNHKYVVATVNNAKHTDLVNSLQVTYQALQGLSTPQLKTELLKLYALHPQALISLNLYDNYGRLVTTVDARKNEVNYSYDEFGRVKHLTDKNGNIIKSTQYNYKN